MRRRTHSTPGDDFSRGIHARFLIAQVHFLLFHHDQALARWTDSTEAETEWRMKFENFIDGLDAAKPMCVLSPSLWKLSFFCVLTDSVLLHMIESGDDADASVRFRYTKQAVFFPLSSSVFLYKTALQLIDRCRSRVQLILKLPKGEDTHRSFCQLRLYLLF